MKLIEAMKRLRVIEKRMDGNAADIERYSSMVSTEIPIFESQEEQKRKVKGLVQANGDLLQEYLNLKSRIERTNLETRVRISEREHTIAELLVIKRKLAQSMIRTFEALNEKSGAQRLRNAPQIEGRTPHVVRFYTENDRNEGLRSWQDFYHEIDSRLEVVNATTELLNGKA